MNLANDGRLVGNSWRDTHLRIAHEIARRIVRPPHTGADAKELVAAWYVAVAATLSRGRDLAGLKDHLEEARERFPHHAEIQFLSGCWAESMAAPGIQAALAGSELKRPSQMKSGDLHQLVAQSPSTIRRSARDMYRGALRIDADHDEARIRLAWIVMLEGDAAQAVSVLERPPVSADPVLHYYRLLFVARAYERQKRVTEAGASFQAAARLFPSAQSPWLALTALAALEGDARASRDALERVFTRTESIDDPWWVYEDCSGRDATRIYGDFVRRVRQLPHDPAGAAR